MDLIAIFLLIVPGFFAEFLYESALPQKRLPDTFYKILRALFFNVPITIVEWLVIWVYKYSHGYPMVKGYSQFLSWSMNSAFMLHYLLILVAELLVFYIITLVSHKLVNGKK